MSKFALPEPIDRFVKVVNRGDSKERIFLREIFAPGGFAVNAALDFHREGAKKRERP